MDLPALGQRVDFEEKGALRRGGLQPLARRFSVRFRRAFLSSSLPRSRSDKGFPSYSDGSS